MDLVTAILIGTLLTVIFGFSYFRRFAGHKVERLLADLSSAKGDTWEGRIPPLLSDLVSRFDAIEERYDEDVGLKLQPSLDYGRPHLSVAEATEVVKDVRRLRNNLGITWKQMLLDACSYPESHPLKAFLLEKTEEIATETTNIRLMGKRCHRLSIMCQIGNAFYVLSCVFAVLVISLLLLIGMGLVTDSDTVGLVLKAFIIGGHLVLGVPLVMWGRVSFEGRGQGG